MPLTRDFSIVAVGNGGVETVLSVRTNAARCDWAHGTSVTLPNGKHLAVVSHGLYQAMGSSDLYRSSDPAAP
jgi:hypothetical protein